MRVNLVRYRSGERRLRLRTTLPGTVTTRARRALRSASPGQGDGDVLKRFEERLEAGETSASGGRLDARQSELREMARAGVGRSRALGRGPGRLGLGYHRRLRLVPSGGLARHEPEDQDKTCCPVERTGRVVHADHLPPPEPCLTGMVSMGLSRDSSSSIGPSTGSGSGSGLAAGAGAGAFGRSGRNSRVTAWLAT